MADVLKVLGQSAPNATSEDDIYTVPNLTLTTCSSMSVCNRGATATTFRIYIGVAGAAAANKQYIFYDAPISGNSTVSLVLGWTLNQTDVVRVYAGNANLSFNLFGVETT